MGYSTDDMGRLCCDSCGKAGGVRRRACPHGSCTSWAACPACWKDPVKRAVWSKYHVEQDCEGMAARFDAAEARVAELKAAGEYVFCASVYADSTRETVKCWFRNAADKTVEMVVPKAVRDTFDRFTTYASVAR